MKNSIEIYLLYDFNYYYYKYKFELNVKNNMAIKIICA